MSTIPNQKIKNIFFQVSAILILVSAVLFNFFPAIAQYMMIAGAVGFATSVFTTPYPGKRVTGKRVTNLLVFAAILMCVSAYLMFAERNEWMYTLPVAALLTLYGTIASQKIYKQELEDEKKRM